MQNIDFYSGKSANHPQLQYTNQQPEYFSAISGMSEKDAVKSHKRANRLLAVILSLCIISFTTGLIIGLKYTGGANQQIVDSETRQAVSQLGNKVNSLIDHSANTQSNPDTSASDNTVSAEDKAVAVAEKNPAQVENEEIKQNQNITKTFPKSDFPYVLQIEGRYTLRQSKDIASYLSKKGNTVLISKSSEMYNIYVGPFKNEILAKNSLQNLKQYTDNNWYKNVLLVKR